MIFERVEERCRAILAHGVAREPCQERWDRSVDGGLGLIFGNAHLRCELLQCLHADFAFVLIEESLCRCFSCVGEEDSAYVRWQLLAYNPYDIGYQGVLL